MYLISSGLKRLSKDKKAGFTADQTKALGTFEKSLDQATRFIPIWVKVAVAIALGLGTMIGWKRVVVTVGEKIGKQHLTYAQGMVAEVVTTATIFGADAIGVPVSTTHILTSGVAGTMSGNGSGLQWSTVRNMATAWVLTLPVSILLSASLYAGFSAVL
jgi:PiT family inorganic phosphate transporter